MSGLTYSEFSLITLSEFFLINLHIYFLTYNLAIFKRNMGEGLICPTSTKAFEFGGKGMSVLMCAVECQECGGTGDTECSASHQIGNNSHIAYRTALTLHY